MKNLVSRFVKDESGATAIEYGLIAAGIAIAIITAVQRRRHQAVRQLRHDLDLAEVSDSSALCFKGPGHPGPLLFAQASRRYSRRLPTYACRIADIRNDRPRRFPIVHFWWLGSGDTSSDA